MPQAGQCLSPKQVWGEGMGGARGNAMTRDWVYNVYGEAGERRKQVVGKRRKKQAGVGLGLNRRL